MVGSFGAVFLKLGADRLGKSIWSYLNIRLAVGVAGADCRVEILRLPPGSDLERRAFAVDILHGRIQAECCALLHDTLSE